MSSFFRSFFAALLALIIFTGLIMVMALFATAVVMSTEQEVKTGENAVLVVDLSDHFSEIPLSDPVARLMGREGGVPSLYNMIRMIHYASNDESVKGIYIKCDDNANDFGASEELRNAIVYFKSKGKFVYAYGNIISQKAYYVANVADTIYCAPTGGMEWRGMVMQTSFLKGTLEKLEIEPQIFYAGKFKSATEPFREKKMSDANRLQTAELLHDMYADLLIRTAEERGIDTATLHRYADSNAVQFAPAAVQLKLIDGVRYKDEVKKEIRQRLGLEKEGAVNFVFPDVYEKAAGFRQSGQGKIAVIYAEGTIIDGKGERGSIGGDTYSNYIRRAREDNSVDAIVLRINSGGGSAMASELMWREVYLAKKQKPVVVSFGDVAASGGYYMSCAADTIFAQPNTITGSIGVFGIIPNMQQFFDHKLGVTFDEVTTSPHAAMMSVSRPLTPLQRQYIQNEIDTIYHDFKLRVAQGRRKSMEYVDSIAQGRVWSGERALELGLVDRMGGLHDAITTAAAMARLSSYGLREYPGKQSVLELILGSRAETVREAALERELGAEGYRTYSTIRDLQRFVGRAQARLPFNIIIQ